MVELRVGSSLWLLVLCVLVCVANSLTLLAIGHYRQLRTKCNLLVAHLALVDLITGLVTWPVLQFLAVDGGSKINCLLSHAIVISLKETSQFLLFAIAAVMYAKIAYPLRYGFWLSLRRLHILSAVPWVLGSAVGFACLVWAYQGQGYKEVKITNCFVTVIPLSYWVGVINWPFIAISVAILVMYVRIVRIARTHCRQPAVNYRRLSVNSSSKMLSTSFSSSLQRLAPAANSTSLLHHQRRFSLRSSAPSLAVDTSSIPSQSSRLRPASTLFSLAESDVDTSEDKQQQDTVRASATMATNNNTASNGEGIHVDTCHQVVTWIQMSSTPALPVTTVDKPTNERSSLTMTSPSSIRRSRQELQVTLTMMATFLAFVLCWLPLEVAIYLANAGVILDGTSLYVQVSLDFCNGEIKSVQEQLA